MSGDGMSGNSCVQQVNGTDSVYVSFSPLTRDSNTRAISVSQREGWGQ